MNGRASELVKSPSTALEVVALGGRDAIAQGVPEISRYSAVEKFPHKALDALEELRSRRFGESNS